MKEVRAAALVSDLSKVGTAQEARPPAALGANSLFVLERRILLRAPEGHLIEDYTGLTRRVARAVAKTPDAEESYAEMLRAIDFLPNSPCLTNAGKPRMSMSACFVLPIEDSVDEIFQAVRWAAMVHKAGGGTGFSGAKVRPHGSIVASTAGIASGPIGMVFQVVNDATEQIKQGSTRRGANMGILPIWHPDILRFIRYKREDGKLANFNISVAVTDAFMETLAGLRAEEPHVCRFGGVEYLLRPDGASVRRAVVGSEERFVTVAEIWREIVECAYRNGDPGIYFIDEANLKNAGLLDPMDDSSPDYCGATNPCGEQPLCPFDACMLGSINLRNMVILKPDGSFQVDWGLLEATTRRGVRFLNDTLDANYYPIPEIAAVTKRNRKIGLGVMGWADMLLRLGISYDDPASWALGEKIASKIEWWAWDESYRVAKTRGAYPGFADGAAFHRAHPELREITTAYAHGPANMAITCVAPTGTLSTIAGCSSGIEPNFSWAFLQRRIDTVRVEIHPMVEEVIGRDVCVELRIGAAEAHPGQPEKQVGWMNLRLEGLMRERGAHYVTARDVSVEAHLEHQAAWQRHVTDAVSKTINFSHEKSIDDVDRAYRWAHANRLKGVTVYREGSRKGEVLSTGLDAVREGAAEPRRGRPDILPAVVIRDKVEVSPGEFQHTYVTIGLEGAKISGGRPYEVFLAGDPRADPRVAQAIDSVTRLVSTSLRHGVGVNVLVKQLDRIRGQQLYSLPRKVGHALLRALEFATDVPEEERRVLELCSEVVEGKACGGQRVFQEGCYKCLSCHATKCG